MLRQVFLRADTISVLRSGAEAACATTAMTGFSKHMLLRVLCRLSSLVVGDAGVLRIAAVGQCRGCRASMLVSCTTRQSASEYDNRLQTFGG